MKALLLAEKASLKNEIKAVYDKFGFKDEIEFESFSGHTMSLKKPNEYKKEWGGVWNKDILPMIPDRFEYKVSEDKISMFKRIKDKVLSGKYDYIINAGDPDREGELIVISFLEAVGNKLPVKRYWQNDLTEASIKKALNELIDSNTPRIKNLGEASKCRARFDWLVGMNFTVATTLQMAKGLPIKIGRVKTPTLKIVVDRENAIRNFVPENFYELTVDFKNGKGEYNGRYIKGTTSPRFKEIKDVNKIVSDITGKTGVITNITNKIESKDAPQLYALNSLQVEASKLHSYLPDEVKALVQSLYEKKILSYPRTDCPYLSSEIAKDFNKLLTPIMEIPELKPFALKAMNDSETKSKIAKNKKYINDKELENSGHYAIIPTGQKPNLVGLSQDEINILDMVCRRFVSIFMPPMKTSVTTINTEVEEHNFKTEGRILVDEGFMCLYKQSGSDKMLPPLKKGDISNIKEIKPVQKTTTPPKRFTDGELLKVLENPTRLLIDSSLKETISSHKGIGTPATRDTIVKQLVTDGYLIRTQKTKKSTPIISPSEIGMTIIKNLEGKEIVSVDMTGIWENNLAKVEKGEKNSADFMQTVIKYVEKGIEDIQHTNMQTVFKNNGNDSVLKGKCPKCASAIKEGKNYYLCAKYKADTEPCDFAVNKVKAGAKIKTTDMEKILSGKETREMTFTGQTNNKFKAKLYFDKESGKISYKFANSTSNTSPSKTEPIMKCPCCGKNIVDTGRFYKCDDYKKGCEVLISYEIKGAKISKSDAKALLSGEIIKKNFTWTSGKTGEAKLKMTLDKNKKTCKPEFIFK